MSGQKFLPGIESLGHPQIESLLLWKDPKVSGAALAGAAVVYYFLEWSGVCMFTILCNLAMLFVFATFVWNNAAHFLQKSKPQLPAFLTQDITPEQVAAAAEAVLSPINKVRATVVSIAKCESPLLSIKALGVLFAVRKTVSMFGGVWTTAFLGVLLAFALPKVYELKHKEIDEFLALAGDKLGDVKKQLSQYAYKGDGKKTQ